MGIEELIRRLENQKTAIERALTSLREVDGGETSDPQQAVTETTVEPAGKNRRSDAQKKRSTLAALRRVDGRETSTTKAAADAVAGPGAPARREKLREGTMKARTVELLRTAAKPMRSGEVAKRMKIGSGYASVNLSQLRRAGFLSHTPEGYAVI
jgi:hypothetical protein